jgi:hypothetical protein
MSAGVEGPHSSRRLFGCRWELTPPGQPGDRAILLRVQRLGLEQRAGNRIELFAMET